MQEFVVELKVRIVVSADNPGMAVSETVRKFKEPLAKHAPDLLNAVGMEAAAFPVMRL